MLANELREMQTRVKDAQRSWDYDDHIDRLKDLNNTWASDRTQALSQVAGSMAG